MKSETKLWLEYADENYKSSIVLLESHLYNPCLQNIQQTCEKSLKSIFIEYGIKLQKTHNINTLVNILAENKIFVDVSEDEINLIDSIYMTSKYPLGSVLADFEPDENICKECINISEKLLESVQNIFK